MRRIWSNFISLAFLVVVGLNSGTCVALQAIDTQVVLQVCQAFSKKAPELMPAVVLPEAAERFVETYGRFSDLLEGCLSATEIKRESNGAEFLIQNTRYVSYWYFSADAGSIRRIDIARYRAVTLADDESWQYIQEPRLDAAVKAGAAATKPARPPARPRPHPKINDAPKPSAAPPEPNIVEFFYATNRKESAGPVALERPPQTEAAAMLSRSYAGATSGDATVSGCLNHQRHRRWD
jgi:hypothetical protein